MDEGEEWFGGYQTPTQIEVSALGDTINRTSRLSDFAQDGTNWVTKNMLSKLQSPDRGRVTFGIRHRSGVSDTFVPCSYARISNLVDLHDSANGKLSDIAGLTMAEIMGASKPAES